MYVQVLGKGAFGTVYHAEDGAKQAFACKSISKAKLITDVRPCLLWQSNAAACCHRLSGPAVQRDWVPFPATGIH